MKRVIIVYNPRATRCVLAQEKVFAEARGLAGFLVGKFEIVRASVEENVKRLAGIVQDGDLVVAMGGDGTVLAGLNGCMLAEKDVKFGVIGLGNFNDNARIFRTRTLMEIINGEERMAYPLKIEVDERHFRYALCYATVGMLAKSARMFDDPKVRARLKKRNGKFWHSILVLVGWYFRNKRKEKLPAFNLDGQLVSGFSDYIAVNSPTMAKIMKGGKWYENPKVFWRGLGRLNSFWRLMIFMAKSMLVRIPGEESKVDILEFEKPATVEIQAEGEAEELAGIRQIRILKSERAMKIMVGKY